MPKSTVSRKITKLESDLGIKLLRKNTHQLTVTDLGEKIYSHGLNILTEANHIRALVEGSKQEPQGVLRVAIPVFVGIDFASRVAATFLQRYPQSQLEIRLVDSMVHPIKDGFDVVFGVGPLQDSTLIARKLFTIECFLCASPDFVEQFTGAAHDAGAVEQAAVRQLRLSRRAAQAGAEPRAKSATNWRRWCRVRANNFQIIKQNILQGLGIGAMPKQIICSGELQDGSIVPILPDWSLEAVDVYMIYPFQLSFSNLISAFYETALEIITQNIERASSRRHQPS